jgi:hypothetical protein
VTFTSVATAVCRSILGSTCTTGSIINRPNIAVVLSGIPPGSCCVQSQDGTDDANLPWAEGARLVKWIVLLEVPGLRANESRKKAVKRDNLYIKDASGRESTLPDKPA